MVLAGKINKTLVNLIELKGGSAIGLSALMGICSRLRSKNRNSAMSARSQT